MTPEERAAGVVDAFPDFTTIGDEFLIRDIAKAIREAEARGVEQGWADCMEERVAMPCLGLGHAVKRLNLEMLVDEYVRQCGEALALVEQAKIETGQMFESRCEAVRLAVLAEREACAKIADANTFHGLGADVGKGIAAAIRARSKT